MTMSQRANVYDSQTSDYHKAFQVFLDHTDQKAQMQQWLYRLVEALPSRRVFIDAGAGNGAATAWFADTFDRTIALEPNASLRAELRSNCPQAEVFPEKIMDAELAALGDLVLCSHLLYHINESEWTANLERLASWLSADGTLVVVLQHHASECMQMLRHFFGRSFDLSSLAKAFQDQNGNRYELTLETVPAHIATPDFDAAYTIAEFMLNDLPKLIPPTRSDLEEYVRARFACPTGGFRFSCDQDFLTIRPRI